MFLYIIRHGDPDYAVDGLTELGLRQAELTAERLCISGIDQIYASPLGRAQMTAGFLSRKLSLPVQTINWARELGDDCRTSYPDGVLKGTGILPSTHLHDKKVLAMDEKTFFATVPGICDNNVPGRCREIGEGIDGLLAEHGYCRTEEGFYFPEAPNAEHIALFCHGAMIRSIISHLLHIPYQYLCTTMHKNPCGITVFRFRQNASAPLVPEMVSFGDVGHLYADGEPQHFYLTGELF